METGRLEAFSEGVIAILITIMVLELKVPHEPTLSALGSMTPVLLSYLMSFIYLGIYWNNHHHLFAATDRISGAVLWANNHLLFWLSLVPFVTRWMGEHYLAALPVALYGVVLFMNGVAYGILARLLVRREGPDSVLARAFGNDRKMIGSVVAYAVAIAAAWVLPVLSLALYAAVALAWLVPDRRIEKAMQMP